MGNYKFKLSDMMPNAWFYKLRDMGRTKKQSNSSKKPPLSHPRRSIYHSQEPPRGGNFFASPSNLKISDTHFPDFPRKSSTRRRSRRKTIYKPSPRPPASSVPVRIQDYIFSSSDSSEIELQESPVSEPESNSFESHDLSNELSSWSSSCTCRVTSSTTDIIIDVNEKCSSVSKKIETLKGFDSFPRLQLRPILTKPVKSGNENPNHRRNSGEEQSTLSQKQRRTGPVSRKSFSNSAGLKLKSNSPKIVNNRIRSGPRRSSSGKRFSKSLAVVKSSVDPERDFRDSMVEMIVENGISASKDLEELLACYLSLNSDEYHDLIIKAFEQIWFQMPNLKL